MITGAAVCTAAGTPITGAAPRTLRFFGRVLERSAAEVDFVRFKTRGGVGGRVRSEAS